MSIEDIESIKKLKAQYFRHVDTKDWVRWADVFTEDAILTYDVNVLTDKNGPQTSEPSKGREAIVAGAKAVIGDASTVHHGFMPEIELTSPTTAEGIWAMEDILEWPDSRKIHAYGFYNETYRKEQDGQWRIATLHLVRIRVDITGPWPQ